MVKDKRIVELNDIVEEVKDSEEWEAVKMNILEIGIEKGMQQGAEKKMLELVEKKLRGQTISQIADALEESEEKIQEIADSIQKDKSPL